MEYKNYKQEADGYVLKAGSVVLYFGLAVLGLLCLGLFFAGVKSGNKSFYFWGLLFLAIGVITYYRRKNDLFIQPSQKRIIQRKSNGEVKKEYPLDKFLNFEVITTRSNGIPVGRQVNMYFDENGKNKAIQLKSVFGNKAAEKLINETKEIMGMGETL